MAASFNDMNALAASTTFLNRVQMAMELYCTVVGSESASTIPFHRERATFAAGIVNNPTTYAPLFAGVAAVNAVVIADATSSGTVVLTSTNIATQQALIPDTDISNAIAAQFNTFFRTPAN